MIFRYNNLFDCIDSKCNVLMLCVFFGNESECRKCIIVESKIGICVVVLFICVSDVCVSMWASGCVYYICNSDAHKYTFTVHWLLQMQIRICVQDAILAICAMCRHFFHFILSFIHSLCLSHLFVIFNIKPRHGKCNPHRKKKLLGIYKTQNGRLSLF